KLIECWTTSPSLWTICIAVTSSLISAVSPTNLPTGLPIESSMVLPKYFPTCSTITVKGGAPSGRVTPLDVVIHPVVDRGIFLGYVDQRLRLLRSLFAGLPR